MREIIFRGKRVIDGKWVESCCPLGEMHSGTVTYDFDSKTVCQYTGLTDKNGRKIFEGDIVSAWSEGSHAIGKVKQRTDGLWLLYPAWQNRIMWGLCPNDKGETTVEVIGNIYDNPALVGVT